MSSSAGGGSKLQSHKTVDSDVERNTDGDLFGGEDANIAAKRQKLFVAACKNIANLECLQQPGISHHRLKPPQAWFVSGVFGSFLRGRNMSKQQAQFVFEAVRQLRRASMG